MKKSLQLLLIVALVATSSLVAQKNVLLIISDDFNHWLPEIGYYPHAQTPNLSALADKGVLFTDAQNSSPVCNPSRNAFMSGLRPATTGISANQDGYFRDKPGCANALSMNQYFTQQGYFTKAGGKIYHPGSMGDVHTDPNNWSELYTGGSGAGGGSAYAWEVGAGSPIKWSGGTGNINNNNDTKLANHFASEISSYNRNKPFFFAVGIFRPHLPWNCPKQFFDLYNPNSLDIPDGYQNGDGTPSSEHTTITGAGKWKDGIRAYLANLSYADYNAGIMLDALESSPHKNNTIVVFFGDHGWHLGEKNRWKKAATWEQANHTTLIIYDPSANGNGSKCHKVVSLQDVYPTLVELAGLPATNKIEGNSIAPLLNNPSLGSWDKPVMMTYRGTHSIKSNQYKLIDEGANSKLFDVVNDPHEFNNLYGQSGYNGIVSDLRAEIDNYIQIGQQVKQNLSGGSCTLTDITDLDATLTNCSTAVLTWTPQSCATEYIVRRKPSGGAYINLGNVTGSSFTDNSLALNSTYIYQVRPFDGTTKMVSNNPQVTTPADCGTPPGNALPIPGKIEAEDFSAQQGVQTETTSDAGGGQNVGWIAAGDWMDYDVDVASAGTYEVAFRVASKSATISLDLKKGNTVLTSLSTATTGGWQTWKTVTKTVTLSAGEQTLRILATGSNWNINWIDFTAASTPPATVPFGDIQDLAASASGCSVELTWTAMDDVDQFIIRRKVSGDATYTNLAYIGGASSSYTDNTVVGNTTYIYQVRPQQGTVKKVSNNPSIVATGCSKSAASFVELSVNIFPNPATNMVTVSHNDETANISVLNLSGQLIISKDNFLSGEQINVSELTQGSYILKIESDKGTMVERLVIQ